MQPSSPDHHDAELVLKLYELRRESVMRESRAAISGQFLPRSFDDVAAIAQTDHPLNRAYRQVNTYWEMAYSLVKHGTLNADLAMESNGEGLLLLAKVWPWLDRIRAEINPRAFRNAEWVATQTDAGKYVFGLLQARIEKQRGS